MIEGQWCAARALIGWSQSELAQKIGASVQTIKRLESGSRNVSEDMMTRAKEALESAGVEFIAENGGGAGVRLRKGKPDAGFIAAEDLNASNDE
jgi:transcriptional regulator with XRE-family HTH domain